MALRIKEVIKEKGMTVQTLADKMGINRVGLSNQYKWKSISCSIGKDCCCIGSVDTRIV